LTSGNSDAQSWASECPSDKNYKWRQRLIKPIAHSEIKHKRNMETASYSFRLVSASLAYLFPCGKTC